MTIKKTKNNKIFKKLLIGFLFLGIIGVIIAIIIVTTKKKSGPGAGPGPGPLPSSMAYECVKRYNNLAKCFNRCKPFESSSISCTGDNSCSKLQKGSTCNNGYCDFKFCGNPPTLSGTETQIVDGNTNCVQECANNSKVCGCQNIDMSGTYPDGTKINGFGRDILEFENAFLEGWGCNKITC